MSTKNKKILRLTKIDHDPFRERPTKKRSLDLENPLMVEQEGSILHTKSFEDRLKSIITEVNEEVDYWYYLLEPAYNRYLASKE